MNEPDRCQIDGSSPTDPPHPHGRVSTTRFRATPAPCGAPSRDFALLIGVDRDLLDLQAIDDIAIIRPGDDGRRTTGFS